MKSLYSTIATQTYVDYFGKKHAKNNQGDIDKLEILISKYGVNVELNEIKIRNYRDRMHKIVRYGKFIIGRSGVTAKGKGTMIVAQFYRGDNVVNLETVCRTESQTDQIPL